MPGQYAIVARFVAKPGCAMELRTILLDTAKLALEEEPGCHRFEILQGLDADGNSLPDVFMTTELFDDFAAVEAHRNSWRTPIRIARIRELVVSAGRVEMAMVQRNERDGV
jgi:autoinducer 2-degrading protein